MSQFLQIVLSGLAVGAVYSLIAIGFTVVYNAMRVVNFANGEFVMMGGLIGAALLEYQGWPLAVAIPASVASVVALALVMELTGMRLARRKTVLNFAMITIGFGVLYRGLMQVLVGRDILFMPAFGLIPDLRVSGVFLGAQSIWSILVLLLAAGGLHVMFAKTRLGKAMRAASQNPRAAALCGIDPRLMAALAFAIAGAAGGLAGALVTPQGAAFYDFGLVYGIKGFAAAILGGIGNPMGAVVGGIVIGVIESLSAGYLASGYKDAVALLILLGFLLAMPHGLFGRRDVRRV